MYNDWARIHIEMMIGIREGLFAEVLRSLGWWNARISDFEFLFGFLCNNQDYHNH